MFNIALKNVFSLLLMLSVHTDPARAPVCYNAFPAFPFYPQALFQGKGQNGTNILYKQSFWSATAVLNPLQGRSHYTIVSLCLQTENCLYNPGRCIEKIAIIERWLLRNMKYLQSPLYTLLYLSLSGDHCLSQVFWS